MMFEDYIPIGLAIGGAFGMAWMMGLFSRKQKENSLI